MNAKKRAAVIGRVIGKDIIMIHDP